MDVEWAKDGETGELYIVQARPETVRSRQNQACLKQTHVSNHGEQVLSGTAIGSDAAKGKVRVINDIEEIATFKPGEILVADMTDPDWVSTYTELASVQWRSELIAKIHPQLFHS